MSTQDFSPDHTSLDEQVPKDDSPSQEKERLLWEAIRDEHFQVVEQLPLTIHRQYSLLRELDERTGGYLEKLLPLMKDYIDGRQKCALPDASDGQDEEPSTPPHPNHTRALLADILHLSDDLARSSEEKVNIALAVNNSVKRHIRLLDHAIRETQSSLGSQPGASAAPIHLPDLVVPRWSRNSRNSLSPVGDLDADIIASPQSTRNKKLRGKSGSSANTTVQLTFRGVAAGPPFALTAEDLVVDSSERRYCYCQEVSFGEMIACDNPKCEREWFHLACVELEEPPKGKWFCAECSAKRKNKKK